MQQVEQAVETARDVDAGTGISCAPTKTICLPVGISLERAERSVILATLEFTDGNKTHASAILGISMKTLYNRLNVYDAEERGRASAM